MLIEKSFSLDYDEEVENCAREFENLETREKSCNVSVYVTISRRRRGDYKPIFTEPKAK